MINDNQVVGIYPVIEALKSGKNISKVLIQNNLGGDDVGVLIEKLKAKDIPIQKVPRIKLDKISKINHQGVLALISPIEFYDLEEIIENCNTNNTPPIFLILDGITDTRNFGAICRTAECMGVHGIIISKNKSAPINSGTIKSSAGAIFNTKIVRVNHLLDAIYTLQAYSIPITSCTEKAEESVYDLKSDNAGCALIFGSEESGINKKILSISDNLLKIPMYGSIESLNVGVAVGMCLYELRKKHAQNG